MKKKMKSICRDQSKEEFYAQFGIWIVLNKENKIERKSRRKENLEENKKKNMLKLNKLVLYDLLKLILFVSLCYIRIKKN